MNKYVYLIRSGGNGYCKIGVSNNPENRRKQLQTSNPYILTLENQYETEFANLVEKTLHRRYSHYRTNGEWFDLPIEDQINFINECKKIHIGISVLKTSENYFI